MEVDNMAPWKEDFPVKEDFRSFFKVSSLSYVSDRVGRDVRAHATIISRHRGHPVPPAVCVFFSQCA